MREHTGFTHYKRSSMKVFFISFVGFSLLDILLGIVRKIQDFVLPISEFVLIVVGLVLADWVTGIAAARKAGDKITAKRMQVTIEKMILYFIALLLSEGMRRVFHHPVEVPFTYITALSISVTEFKSNIENVEKATGVKIWQYIKERVSNLFKN